jgi:hypothetical protein
MQRLVRLLEQGHCACGDSFGIVFGRLRRGYGVPGEKPIHLLKGGTRCPQRVGRQLVWLSATQSPKATANQPYPPPLKPAEPNNTEQPACDGRRLRNYCCCVEPDIVDNGLEIIAI